MARNGVLGQRRVLRCPDRVQRRDPDTGLFTSRDTSTGRFSDDKRDSGRWSLRGIRRQN